MNFGIAVDYESGVSKFINVLAYGERWNLLRIWKKGYFVKIIVEDRVSTDDKEKEPINIKAVYLKF